MTERVYCSFCCRSDLEAAVMIAGPVLVFICDECVEICRETVAKKLSEMALQKDWVKCSGCAPCPLQAVPA